MVTARRASPLICSKRNAIFLEPIPMSGSTSRVENSSIPTGPEPEETSLPAPIQSNIFYFLSVQLKDRDERPHYFSPNLDHWFEVLLFDKVLHTNGRRLLVEVCEECPLRFPNRR